MALETSILTSIKKMVGLIEEDTSFDQDILVFINAAFSRLHELGVGATVFVVADESVTWDSLSLSTEALSNVKTYIFLRVRLFFDPPSAGYLVEAYQKEITKHESLLNTFHDVTAETTYADLVVESEV